MTISCQTWGREWGSDDMVQALEDVRSLGVNWIAIHPYARIHTDGTVVLRQRAYADASWLTRPIEEAHRLGLKVLIKPHLAYWGSSFSWRGDIAFDSTAQWQRFFTTYKKWILTLAELCKDADAFVVGTELDRTVGYEEQWRALIAALRVRTKVPLTYAANWSDYQRIEFWDALDVIGIQAYFPLTEHDDLPEVAELDASWRKLSAQLAQFAARHRRKILFTEFGYNRSSQAARRPWASQQGGDFAEETQRRCLAAALSAIQHSEVIVGGFLWKWFPGDVFREDFLMSTPSNRDVIRRFWDSAAAGH